MSGCITTGDVARTFARCLSGPEGARVMTHLRALTLDRVLAADAECRALRHLEGQRALVKHIEILIERGRQADRSDPFHSNNSETDHAEQTTG